MKIRKDSKNQPDIKPVTSSWDLRHAGETMNTQIRNENAKTKKLNSSQENNNKINNKQYAKVKPSVAYDYDAAVSQPDVPNFLEQKYNTNLPIRKKGFYSREKSRSSIKKTGDAASEEASASSTKSQDKETELQFENTKCKSIDSHPHMKIIDALHGEKENRETARNVKIFTKDESPASMFPKNDSLKNDPEEEKDRRLLVAERKDKVEYLDGIASPRSSTSLKRESKIPRTKTLTSPAIIQISRKDSAKRLSLTSLKRSSHDGVTSKKDAKQESLKKYAPSKYVSSKLLDSNRQRSEKNERRDETIITETSPAVIGCISEPSTFVVLPKIKQKNENQSCDDCNPESSYQEADETLSDSRSLPEKRYVQRKSRRSFKHRKYIDTSSDDFDISSDSSTESREKKSIFTDPAVPVAKSSLATKQSSKTKNRRGSSFSFFNTLFDIVFWPFLFLKSDR